MVFGKTWMPKNATVHATGNITKSRLLSPSSTSNQSENFHGQGGSRTPKSMTQNNLTSYKKVQQFAIISSENNFVNLPQSIVGTAI